MAESVVESVETGAEITEFGSMYETQAPEMRPIDEGKKSVKWHRLDYYEIAPLKDGEENKAGVLSRGGLMRRTAKRLRNDNHVVQLAAIHRCANEFHFLIEGPCLRPLLECIRDLAGHGRPSTPSAPNLPAKAGLASISKPSTAKGKFERDNIGYGLNLLVALQALISFLEDKPLEIPEGVLEAAGESSLDGQQEEHMIRIAKPPSEAEEKKRDSVLAGTDGSNEGAVVIDPEEEIRLAEIAAEAALNKIKTKRASLIAKEMQRKKTMFESTDLLVLMMSPLCSVSSAALTIFEALYDALAGEELEMIENAAHHGLEEHNNAMGEESNDEASAAPTQISTSNRTGVTGVSTVGGGGVDASRNGMMRMLVTKGNPAAAISNVIPKLNTWRLVAEQASNRKAELAERMAAVAEASSKASAETAVVTEAADAVRARCAEARGNKKRKKALPPELADELAVAEQAEETAMNAAEIAANKLSSAEEELIKLGTEVKSYKNDCAVSVDDVVSSTARVLRIVKFLYEENGELTLAQLIEGNINTVPVLLQFLLDPDFFPLCRIIFHAMSRPDIIGGAAAIVLGGGSEPFITVLERQIKVCRALPPANKTKSAPVIAAPGGGSGGTDTPPTTGSGRVSRAPSMTPSSEPQSRRPSGIEQEGIIIESEPKEVQDTSGTAGPLVELIEIVEVITAMASCDRNSLSSNPGALKLFPAIPPLSQMLDLKLSHNDATTLNTAVFAALSALGLRSPEGRLQVCEQGAMPLLVKFVVASAGSDDNEGEDEHSAAVMAAREKHLRRTADKALLHLLFSSVDQVDAKVLSGSSPYLPTKSLVEGLSSPLDNGRRRVTRLVSTLTTSPENATALGESAVAALTKSVGTWRNVLAEQDEKEEKRLIAKEREEAAIQARTEATRLAGLGMPEQPMGVLRNIASHREGGGQTAIIGEDDEEDDVNSENDPNGMDELLREDITEVDGLGEVLYALQALSQLTRLGGTKTAMAVGSDEFVEMLVEMLFECGRSDGTEVALRLCIVTDLTWEFESPPGEELSVEFRVLRAEAVNLLTALAHIPETATRVARHAGLALRMVATTYGRFAPGLLEPVSIPQLKGAPPIELPAWKLVLDPRAGQPSRKGRQEDDESSSGGATKTSPQLMLALLRLIEKLATMQGGREGLYAAACKVCFGGELITEQPSMFAAPPEKCSIGDLLANSTAPVGGNDNSSTTQQEGGPSPTGAAANGKRASVESFTPPLPSHFRPSCLVLMGVVGALSGGSMDVLQLQSALRSFKALCRDVKPPLPSILAPKGKSKSVSVNLEPFLENCDGYQPALADIFSACALRLGALVSLVLMPQNVPVVAGAWEVVRESNDLALFLTNRGRCREDFWKVIPAPMSPKTATSKLKKIPKVSAEANDELNEGLRKKDDDEVSVDSMESGEGGNGGGSVAGDSVSSARGPAPPPLHDKDQGGEHHSSPIDEDEEDRGMSDPNFGPNVAQWGHLLNYSAFIQPHSTTIDGSIPAPPEQSEELRDLKNARGSHWTALLAAIGAMPLWVPITVKCTPAPGQDPELACEMDLVMHVHSTSRPKSPPPSASPKQGANRKNRMSKIGNLFTQSSEASRAEEENYEIEVTVLQIKGLPSADMIGKAGPYVQVRLGDRPLATTRTVPYSVNPVFNEKIAFTSIAGDALGLRQSNNNEGLVIEIWDSDPNNLTLICSTKLPVIFPGLNDIDNDACGNRIGEREAMVIEEDARMTAEALIKVLLAGGANPEWRDSGGRTALMHSLALANDTATYLLLEDPRVYVNARDHDGHTVLQYAFASPDPLIAQKALRDLFPPEGHVSEQPSYQASEQPSSGDGLKNDSTSPPMASSSSSSPRNEVLCLEGQLRMIEAVLSAGADPNEPDDIGGDFGLHWALNGTQFDFQLPKGPRGLPKLLRLSCRPTGDVSIAAVQACLDLGDSAVDACNRKGETALHLVVSGGHGVGALDLLLAQGADPNLMDEQGEIAAHRFAKHVVSEAPLMLSKLLEASKGKVLRRAEFNNERRGLSTDAKMELEVDAVFALCAAELKCPRSVAAVTANVDDVLACPTQQGWSLMHCLAGAALFDAAVGAAKQGMIYDSIKILHSSGDETSFAPMLQAALHASPPGSASLKHSDNGLTPAHLAVRIFSASTSSRMIADLMNAGCDPNALALLPPHPKLRYENGENPSDVLTITGSPLTMAVCYPHSEVTAQRMLTYKTVDPNPKGSSPSPLHVACAVGACGSTISALLANKGNQALKTILKTTSSSNNGGGGSEADRAGGGGGVSSNEPEPTPGLSGTPLHAAASVGLLDDEDENNPIIVQLILDCIKTSQFNAMDILNSKDSMGRTALHVACIKDHIATVNALLSTDQGIQLALTPDYEAKSALHAAIDGHSEECVKLLINHSSKIKALVTYGKESTPINLGVVHGGLCEEESEEEDDDDEAKDSLGRNAIGDLGGDEGGGGQSDNGSQISLSKVPQNVLSYAESVQMKTLGPCRLKPLDVFSEGVKKRKRSKSMIFPQDSPMILPKTLKKNFSVREGKSNSLKKATAIDKDYGIWRRAFRSEFQLLTSTSTQVLNKVILFLLRIASGLSDEVSFPTPPSPLRVPTNDDDNGDGEGGGDVFGENKMVDGLGGNDVLSTASSPPKDVLSVGSVDSWENTGSGVGGGGGGDVTGDGTTAVENKVSEALLAREKEKVRQEEITALWAEALGFVTHSDPCYATGGTLLHERWAEIGSVAAVIIQATMRRFLGNRRVVKLKERLKQRRIAQAKAMAGSRRGMSRASVSSRSSAGSRPASRTGSRGSKRSSRANSIRIGGGKGGKGLRSQNSFSRPSSRQ